MILPWWLATDASGAPGIVPGVPEGEQDDDGKREEDRPVPGG